VCAPRIAATPHPPPPPLPTPLSSAQFLTHAPFCVITQGSIYASGAAWLMLDKLGLHWQWFAAVCAFPAGLASVLVATMLPESPRFLWAAGDAAGASASLLTIARWNGRPSRLSQGWELCEPGAGASATTGTGGEEHEAAGLLSSTEVAGSSGSSSGSGGGETASLAMVAPGAKTVAGPRRGAPLRRCGGQCAAITAPMRSLLAPPLRRSSLLLGAIWFALSFGWYGLILWVPTLFCEAKVDLDAYQDAFLVNAANLPGNLVSALLIDRVGRKGVLWGSLLASCASAVAFSFARTEATVLLASCSLNAMSTCSWNALDCLSTETFPTELRTSAMGVLTATGRLGSIAGQLVFGAMLDSSTTVALLCLAGGVLGLGALAAMALPAFKELE
jgi:MFS family permease